MVLSDVVVEVAFVGAEAVVLVSAMRTLGSKAHNVAEGLAELSDKYVSFRTAELMLVRVSWLFAQQMLI